ncbi:unnamed protein product [Symbiodinium natans]|uniref:Uncharacterized protein n=1 Tax=Symbiodinium natans TaxID=878477 RepID=A0A812NKS7_9DINO|nr:unnamed protein product [Symbiodinium natans]
MQRRVSRSRRSRGPGVPSSASWRSARTHRKACRASVAGTCLARPSGAWRTAWLVKGSWPLQRRSCHRGMLGRSPWMSAWAFYDVTDNFIDDAELAAVNAYDTQQQKQKTGGSRKAASRGELDSVRPVVATTEEDQAFLAGFRLTGAEVSGTSDESDWESVEQSYTNVRSNPWNRESRGWQSQLSELKEELMLVDAKPSLASPKAGDLGELPLTEEECLSRIKAVLTEFCEAADAGDQSSGRPALCSQPQLESALADVCRRLPPLLRMPLKPEDQVKDDFGTGTGGFNRRFKRFTLKNLEPKLVQPRKSGVLELTGAEDQVDPFAWSPAEEFAWCCFCWRLLTAMSPGLRRAPYTRQWLKAAREPQQEAVKLVQQELAVRVQKAISAQESGESTGKAKDPSGWVATALKRGALAWPAMALQALWLRKMLWQAQRQSKRVHPIFPDTDSDFSSRKTEVVKAQHKALTVFIINQFDQLGSLKVDKDALGRAMGYRSTQAQGKPSKKEEKEASSKAAAQRTKPSSKTSSSSFEVGHWVEILRQGERAGGGRNAVIEEMPAIRGGEVQLRTPGGALEAHPLKRLKSAHLWRKGQHVQAKIEGKWEMGNILTDMILPKEARVTSTHPVMVCLCSQKAKVATVDFQHVRPPGRSESSGQAGAGERPSSSRSVIEVK